MATGVWTQEKITDGIDMHKARLVSVSPEDKVSNLIKSLAYLANAKHPSPIEIRKCTAELSEAWKEYQDFLNGHEIEIVSDDLPF